MVQLTRLRLGVLSDGPQPVDHVDDEVLLQGEVGVANALGAVDDEHHVQGATALLTVCREPGERWGGLSGKGQEGGAGRTEREGCCADPRPMETPLDPRGVHKCSGVAAWGPRLTTAPAGLPHVGHDVAFLEHSRVGPTEREPWGGTRSASWEPADPVHLLP